MIIVSNEHTVWHCSAPSPPKKIRFRVEAAKLLIVSYFFTHGNKSLIFFRVIIININYNKNDSANNTTNWDPNYCYYYYFSWCRGYVLHTACHLGYINSYMYMTRNTNNLRACCYSYWLSSVTVRLLMDCLYQCHNSCYIIIELFCPITLRSACNAGYSTRKWFQFHLFYMHVSC